MILFILYSLLSACLELAFQEYKKDEMILHFYQLFLKKLWYSNNIILRKLSQVMGLCSYCNGFWLSVLIYILRFEHVSLDIFLFCGLNFIFLKILIGSIDKLFHVEHS